MITVSFTTFTSARSNRMRAFSRRISALYGDVVRPRFTSRRGGAEEHTGRRRWEGPGGPRWRRKRPSGGVVALVSFPAFLTGDVAQGDGDQHRDRDTHPDADPHDLFVNATVAFPWNHAGFILQSTPCRFVTLADFSDPRAFPRLCKESLTPIGRRSCFS